MSKPKHLSDYPYLDGKVNIDPRHLGHMVTLIPGSGSTTSPRAEMAGKQLGQSVVVDGIEFPQIFTGYEHKFIPFHIDTSQRPDDVIIIDVIPRYSVISPITGKYIDSPYSTVIYQCLKDNSIGYCTVDRYWKGNEGFGYFNVLENQDLLKPGTLLPKHVRLAHSPAIQGERKCIGVNANVCYLAIPQVANDANIVSESFAKKMASRSIKTAIINIAANQHPLNLYGTDVEHQFLPEPGQKVRADGILFASRQLDNANVYFDGTSEAMRDPRPPHDLIIRVSPESTILDIEVFYGAYKDKVPWHMYSQLERYLKATIQYYQRIYNNYEKLSKFPISPAFNTLVSTAITRLAMLRAPGFTKHNAYPTDRYNRPIEFMQCIVTYAETRNFNNGFKISNLYGAKGVTCQVWPDEHMPTDEHGFVADVILDAIGVHNRANSGQLIPPEVTRAAEFIRRRVAKMIATEPHDVVWNMLIEFITDASDYYGELLKKTLTSITEQKEYMQECIEHGIAIQIMPFSHFLYDTTYIPRLIKKWDIPISPVTYTVVDEMTGEKETFTTANNVAIGKDQIFLIAKIPSVMSAGVTYTLNNGIPTSIKSPSRKLTSPVSRNPIRGGEDEARIDITSSNPDDYMRWFMLQSSSLYGVQYAVKTLLHAKQPTNIDSINISSDTLKATSIPQALLRHMGVVIGVDFLNLKANPNYVKQVMDSISDLPMDDQSGVIEDDEIPSIDTSEEGDDDI